VGENESNNNESNNKVGWQSLKEIINISHPFFEQSLFLEGVGLSSNVYVIAGDYLTIVDPGNDRSVFAHLFALGFKPADIKKIVLTHGHRDHAFGTFVLLQYPGIMENKELEVIIHEAGPEVFKKWVKDAGFSLMEVGGGESLELSGFECDVVHTPGHTIDSICLHHAPTRTLFTGDTVLSHAMASIDPPGGGRFDFQLLSLRALFKMEIEHILPGHGRPVARDGKRLIEGVYGQMIREMIGPDTSWMAGAVRLARKELLDEALFCCERELAVNPEDLEALQLKASCLDDLSRFKEAIEVFDKISAKETDNLFALVGKGYASMGLGKYEEGIKHFEKALKINPALKDALIYKGIALFMSGRYDEAMDIEDFRTEFVERFKQEMEKKAQSSSQSGS